MKTTRTELKAIIKEVMKECFSELMMEGKMPVPQNPNTQYQQHAQAIAGGNPVMAKLFEQTLQEDFGAASAQLVPNYIPNQQQPFAQPMPQPNSQPRQQQVTNNRMYQLAFGDYQPQLRGFVG